MRPRSVHGVILALAFVPALAYGETAAMADKSSNGSEVTTASGLKYLDQTVGTGEVAVAGKTVTVHYTGWLVNDGKKIDSSVDRNRPFSFPLGSGKVIKGMDEGVEGMKVGGKRKMTIPSNLAYGSRSAGGVIPPDATLIFDVELLEVK